MSLPHAAARRSARAHVAVLVATAGLLAACQEPRPGVYVEFRVDDPRYRPDAVRFTWMRAGAELIVSRLPETGAFTSPGPMLGSIFIETGGPLDAPRLLAVRGLRGDTESFSGELVSGGLALVPASPESVQRWAVVLGQPLMDENGDGKPDIVQHDCLRIGPNACLDSAYGPPTTRPPGMDGGSPAAMADAGAPAEAGPSNPGLASGLLGHWRLDEGSGSEARDSSGQNNHGQLQGLGMNAWVAGKRNGALEIPNTSGAGVLVDLAGPIDSTHRAFTLAAWTYRTTLRSNYATALSRRYLSSTSEHYLLGFQNGIPKALINTHLSEEGNSAMVAGTAAAPLNTWVHVALSYDGQTLRLYQDGTQVGSAAYDQPILADRTPLCLGCNQNMMGDTAADEPLAGRLDDVRWYGRALDPGELGALARDEQPDR